MTFSSTSCFSQFVILNNAPSSVPTQTKDWFLFRVVCRGKTSRITSVEDFVPTTSKLHQNTTNFNCSELLFPSNKAGVFYLWQLITRLAGVLKVELGSIGTAGSSEILYSLPFPSWTTAPSSPAYHFALPCLHCGGGKMRGLGAFSSSHENAKNSIAHIIQ